jgi:hypothetical protein
MPCRKHELSDERSGPIALGVEKSDSADAGTEFISPAIVSLTTIEILTDTHENLRNQ